MDWKAAEADWQQHKARIKAQWAHLSDSTLDMIAGKRVELARKLQEAYGISGAEAEREIRHFEEIEEHAIKDPGHGHTQSP